MHAVFFFVFCLLKFIFRWKKGMNNKFTTLRSVYPFSVDRPPAFLSRHSKFQAAFDKGVARTNVQKITTNNVSDR